MAEKSKNPDKVKQGKKNRTSGSAFERKVREDLESNGWVVDRWGNNVELTKPASELENDKYKWDGKLTQAKAKYNPFTKSLMMSKGGFPDFIAFRKSYKLIKSYDVIGVECKVNGYLKPEEKEKCNWYLKNNIFSKILIAKKVKKGRKVIVEYVEFQT